MSYNIFQYRILRQSLIYVAWLLGSKNCIKNQVNLDEYSQISLEPGLTYYDFKC